MAFRLRISFSDTNPRLAPLVDGSVRFRGVEPEWVRGSPGVLFHRILAGDTPDVFEFSLATSLILSDRRGDRGLEWVALPIFLSKAFLPLRLRVRAAAGIRGLGDLRGRRVGLPDFHMTAAVWLRVILRELHGIVPRELSWVVGRPPSKSQGTLLGIDREPPPGLRIRFVGEGEGSLEDLLGGGELDAAFGDSATAPVATGGQIVPLFDALSGRQVFADFHARTGVLPVNHTVMIRREVAEAHPELPRVLWEGFEAAKRVTYERALAGARGYLLFPEADFADQVAIFGADPYPSGLSANRAMLHLLADELLDEGLITRRPVLERLFAAVADGA